MYKRTTRGWVKHMDFILWDEASLQLAFVLACMIRHGICNPYADSLYRVLALMLALLDLMVAVLLNTMHEVLKRGYFLEFVQTVKHALIVFAGGIIFLFSMQTGEYYSRIILYLTLGLHVTIGYGIRLGWKHWLRRKGRFAPERETMLVVLKEETNGEVIRRLKSSSGGAYQIVGAVLTESGPGEVEGIPVVAALEDAAAYICREWIDSVYIDCPLETPGISKLIQDCREMAVPVHFHIHGLGDDERTQLVEKIGDTMVLTTGAKAASAGSLILKRGMDILGGLVGSLLALIVMMVVGPMIKIASPGPILYRQERIGKNGKRFRILKIRSMHVDADSQKEELMDQNRVKDGRMFKLDFDPRIIGNRTLPDGSHRTGIGEFIRRTSLDEFPQFFNVLKGDMSIVGTRPPTVDEWEKYEFHHRARLACKPGITGMWQVNGRSEITDFEDVVKLDTKYINNWSIGLDLRILMKTFLVVFGRKGAM